MAQMKEQFKAPEKNTTSDEEIANLSDAQLKTLVIRMLQELSGYFNSIKKTQAAMKVALCEIKKNLQETNSFGKETRTQINGLEQKEKRNIQPEQNEETRTQKYEERLRKLQDIFKCFHIWIIGVPDGGEEEEQEVENLHEQIVKENSPNLAKELDFQEAQETHRVPQRSWTQGGTHQGTS